MIGRSVCVRSDVVTTHMVPSVLQTQQICCLASGLSASLACTLDGTPNLVAPCACGHLTRFQALSLQPVCNKDAFKMCCFDYVHMRTREAAKPRCTHLLTLLLMLLNTPGFAQPAAAQLAMSGKITDNILHTFRPESTLLCCRMAYLVRQASLPSTWLLFCLMPSQLPCCCVQALEHITGSRP